MTSSSMKTIPDWLTVLCIATCAIVFVYLKRKRTLPYPPGPPAELLIGHTRMIPTYNREDVFHQWAQTYGDVIYLKSFGRGMVILGSEEAASDLLEKRSSTYSDRPSPPLFERIGWGDVLSFTPYGPEFRQRRKILQGHLDRGEVSKHRPIQEREASVLLWNVLQDLSALDRHIHRYSAAIIMETTYGHRILSDDDEYFLMDEEIINLWKNAVRPSLLDISPYLDKLPSWFPGAWHVQYIRDTKPFITHMIKYPVSVVMQDLERGIAQPSFVSQFLSETMADGQLSDAHIHDVEVLAHQLIRAGSETSWHTIMTFIACIVMNPDAQRKGQEEIDRVVGNSRLPDFTDRDSLPYVECIVQEVQRWHPAVPLGLPHKTMTDDVYRGMYIPKGTIVVANARTMTLDETKFRDPHLFIPERFLPEPAGYGETYLPNATFGWGRRICPGRFLADNTVWLAVARMLAVFNLTEATDTEGNMIEPDIKFVTTVSSHPEPFPYEVCPRSEKAATLILQTYEHVAQVPVQVHTS